MTDIVLILIAAVFAVIGYKKGFVRSVLGIVSLIASVILAWILYPVVADIFASVGFDGFLAEEIQDSLGGYVSGGGSSELPPEAGALFKAGEGSFAEGLSEAAAIIARFAINIIAFIVVLIVSRILMWIAVKFFKVLKSLPVLGAFDGIAGLLLGTLQGIIIIYIALAVIYAAVPFGKCGELRRSIDNSVLAKTMYEHNPIMDILYNIEELGEVEYE